jgi:hypothetical protein
MDLWIRSQNGELLTKVENTKIDCCNGYYRILVNNSTEVAKYGTEKRALEILNRIQDFISFAEFDDVPSGRYEEAQINAIRYLSRNLSKVGKVFYMPEE